MFVGKLIEDRKYYDYSYKNAIIKKYSLLVMTIFYLYFLFFKEKDYLKGILLLLFFLGYEAYSIYLSKLTSKLIKNAVIKIDENHIEIKYKNSPNQDKIFDLNNVDKILVKKNYFLFEKHKIKDFLSLKGPKPPEHYIVLKSADKDQRIDFIFDSYYMEEELKKIIEAWKSKGYNVEEIK